MKQLRDDAKKKAEIAARAASQAKATAKRADDAQKLVNDAQSALEQKDSLIRSLQESLRATRAHADKKEVELKGLGKQVDDLMRENAELKARNATLIRERDVIRQNAPLPSLMLPRAPAPTRTIENENPYN